jgi:hypothetical protein
MRFVGLHKGILRCAQDDNIELGEDVAGYDSTKAKVTRRDLHPEAYPVHPKT